MICVISLDAQSRLYRAAAQIFVHTVLTEAREIEFDFQVCLFDRLNLTCDQVGCSTIPLVIDWLDRDQNLFNLLAHPQWFMRGAVNPRSTLVRTKRTAQIMKAAAPAYGQGFKWREVHSPGVLSFSYKHQKEKATDPAMDPVQIV